jgi:alkylhydroperoxidase family enzyme
MTRLPYLDPEDAEPHTAAVLRKSPDLGIFRMVANAQGAFPAWMRFGSTLFDGDEFDHLLREFAITRVAAMTPGADYEWVQHAAITLAVGGTEEQLAAIEAGDDTAAALGADGRLVVRFATQVVQNASPDDPTFAEMTTRFSAREIVHLLLVIGQYMMLGRIMATSRLDLDPALGPAVVDSANTAIQARRAARRNAGERPA